MGPMTNSAEALPPFPPCEVRLTGREQQFITLVAQGFKNQDVAKATGTTDHIVKNCLRLIYDKLGFCNRVELALWYEARRYEGVQTGILLGGQGAI